MSILQIQTPRVFQPLLQPSRYKGAHGGRGSGKSHFFGELLIETCLSQPTRAVCLREVQKSIKESVKRLLEDKIISMGVTDAFDVMEAEIRCRMTGGLIIFQGMQNHTADSIKSLEGYDIAWGEEAHSFSQRSLDLLRPTIRKPGSELWFSWNPDNEDDPIEKLLRGPNRVEDAIVVEANWRHNPWFPEVLRKEMESDKARDSAKYMHVWEGQYNLVIEGAIFAEELRKATEEGRITRVPLKAGVPVHTFWDLGQSDNTAIWFVQIVGMEYRIIDYYEASGHKMPHYIDVLAARDYPYEEHCLPHDAEHEQLAAKATIKQQLVQALKANPKLGKTVRIVPRIPKKALGIDAARSIFPQCVFDQQKTAPGLKCLRKYCYARDADTGRVSKQPLHDIWSNGADAFLCFAQHFKRPQLLKPAADPYAGQSSGSWMGN